MKHVTHSPKAIAMVGLLPIFLFASSWRFTQSKKTTEQKFEHPIADTIPPSGKPSDKEVSSMNGLDEQMKKLNLQMAELNEQLKDLDSKINSTVNEAIANIDLEKALKEAEASLQQIDFEKLNQQAAVALQKAEAEIKKIDFTKLQNDLKEAQQELKSGQFKREIKEALQNAEKEVKRATENIKETNDFTSALEKEGLIAKDKSYTIEWKENGDLYINGIKQPGETAEKYKKYFRKGGYTINNNQ